MSIWLYILTGFVTVDTAVILGFAALVLGIARNPILMLPMIGEFLRPGGKRNTPSSIIRPATGHELRQADVYAALAGVDLDDE